MADNVQITVNTLLQTADSQRVLPRRHPGSHVARSRAHPVSLP